MIKINDSDFKEVNSTSFLTGYCFININGIDYIVKRLNKCKIDSVYNGNYIALANTYINIMKEIIPCINDLGLLSYNNSIYEIQEKIPSNVFVSDNNIFTWKELLLLYKKILKYIDNISRIKGLGIDSAIWNFTINGIAFDFSPPRLLYNNKKNLFTRPGDSDHYNRTYYRCMTEEGMKLSLLTSVLNAIKHNIKVIGLDNYYLDELIINLIDSIKYNKDQLVDNLCDCNYSSFKKHPINVIQDYIGTDNLCRILKK